MKKLFSSDNWHANSWLWKTVAIALAVLLGVHILYSLDVSFPWLEAQWSAGNVLGYFGSIIGASATIFVLLATIDYEKRAEEERAKRTVRPVIAISVPERPLPGWGLEWSTSPDTDFNPFREREAYSDSREEYVRADCYAIATDVGEVSYKAALSASDYYLAMWAEAQVDEDVDPTAGIIGASFGSELKAWFVKLVLTSMGNGPAINLTTRLVVQDSEGAASGSKLSCSPAVQLMVGRERSLGILVPVGSNDAKEYHLVLSYEDADGRRYEQSHAIVMSRADFAGRFDVHVDVAQKEVCRTGFGSESLACSSRANHQRRRYG